MRLGFHSRLWGGREFRMGVMKLLSEICALIEIDKDGNVSVLQGPAAGDQRVGCCCMEKVILNGFPNRIVQDHFLNFTAPLSANDGYLPQLPPEQGPAKPSSGSPATIHNNPRMVPRDKVGDKMIPRPKFLILAHEICGHMLYFNNGAHRPPIEGSDPLNQEIDALQSENSIRYEHGIPSRSKNSDAVVPSGE